MTGSPIVSVVVVGAGPRGAGILERLSASLPELGPPRLDVHLVDPFPAGAGRIWRHAQSPLLAMNSMAADVTMFTDDTVVCEGPIVPGPSFWEWARDRLDDTLDPELEPELAAVTAATFPSRRLQSAYLTWVLRRVVADAPPQLRVHVHRCRAVGLGEEGGRQVVTLEGGGVLRADAVVLASGHLDAAPTPEERALAAEAGARGLTYLPPEQTTDSDLSVLAPGERVLVRGTGLAFIDLLVLLFEGRGGHYVPDDTAGPDGLRYVPSGAEPRLVVGSPRGMPYHSKTHYPLRAGRPPLPRFFGPDAVDPLIARGGGAVDLRRDAWPLMAKEIAWGWYHELFLGHPQRVRMPWDEFAARFADTGWDTPAMAALLAEAVPDRVDRVDLAALDRPLDGVRAASLAELQPLVRALVAEDLRQHVDPAHSPHLGAFAAMLSVYGETTRLATSGALTPRSQAFDLSWWQGFFNGVASGPPGFRVRELLALARAGLVTFLGAGMRVEVGDEGFRAVSVCVPEPVTTRALVDARLPDASASRALDPLLAALVARGEAVEEVLTEAGEVLRNTGLVRVRAEDGALVDATGRAHPRRFAVGPHTTVKVAGAFTRPGMNAQSLRYNDAVARAVLRAVADVARAAAA